MNAENDPGPRKKEAPSGELDRNDAIGKVWAATVGLLAICIPLVILTKMTFLPLVVLAGAVAATAFLWIGGRDDSRGMAAENEALREQIRKLEERLENVEVINRFEERLAAKEAEKRLGHEHEARIMGPASEEAEEVGSERPRTPGRQAEEPE